MTLKCKNPYFDENIDRKFVFLLYSDLLAKGINLSERCFGLFLKADNVAIIDTEADYNRCMFTEVSIYKAFQYCIPDGIRYNRTLDKLVPDVIMDFKSKEYSMTDWANENLNLNIVAFDDVEQDKKEILNNLGHGHKKTKPFISGIKRQKIDNGGNHIAADGTPFDTIEEALNHNCTLIATSSADEYCSGIKVEIKKDINITLEDRQILNELKQSGKSYLEIINIIKNTDTFTPSYYGAKCKCGEKLDAYAICDKYSNEHKPSAWHHAVKKLIRAGDGHKSLLKDIDEVIDSLKRWKEQLNAK